jgi:hypothetical protein
MELATPTTRALNDPLAAWAVKRVRLESRPFRFEGHEYLRAIYDDQAPHVVLSKAAQIGGTTWAILRSLHACLQGLNVMYYFPTRTDVLDFSRSRVGPLLADNPFLANQMTDTDTVGLKRIGDAHLYFRGMKSSVGMKSVPADMIVFDELDEASPDARTLALERLAHSDYKRIIELSNPSLPGYGIDESYETSDQRHWTLKCPGCGHWTALEREFPEKLGQEIRIILPRGDGTYYRACPKCSKELDLDQGEWVADFPDRNIHGYRVSQLFSSKVDPGEILEDYRTTRHPERFYNLKIGIPWADLERRVDVQTVLGLCRTGEAPKGFHVMGVDTGKDLHAVVLRTNGYNRSPAHVVHLQACHDFRELDELMKRFKIHQCVIDGLPETHATRDFAKRWEYNEVYLCFFNVNQRGEAKWDRKAMKVEINRTEALDASRAMVREKKVTLSPRSQAVEEFARHMACDAKVLEEDEETGAKKYKYIRTGANHYSMAFTYAAMALEGMTIPWSPAQEQWFLRTIGWA